MALVFQYGSNMSTGRLNAENRLKGAAYPVGIAVTENEYEFTFDIRSKSNNCAAADIVPGAGRKIWGVVYEIPDRLIRRNTASPGKSLDAIEGAGTNYQRIEIRLRWPDGRAVAGPVLTYVGLDRRQGIRTSAEYIQHILAGMAEFSMPEDYVRYVKERILANNPDLNPVVTDRSGAPGVRKTRRTEAGIKGLLRTQIVPKLSAQAPYFSIDACRAELEASRCPIQPATLKRYLHELTEAQLIYAAGRAWYSTLSSPFTLNTQPVAELAALIQKQFRFLKFACWSTDQVKPFMQHLLTRNIQFVSAESHTLASAGEFLESNGFTVLVNPTKAEARRFAPLKERTIVLRPNFSKEPEAHPFARIEKLLVDLREEIDCLRLMDVGEYHYLIGEVIRQGRVQMAALLSYTHAKRMSLAELFGDVESTISTESGNVELVD